MNSPSKKNKRKINGVLLLDKPIGISSNTALQQARRLFHAEKAGHTGVLDPLASGLLPICLGEATKFAQYLLDADKAYTATLRLGEATTTGDSEGEIIETSDKIISETDFRHACQSLIGAIEQVPPMFSALKHEGKPLYEYARKGIVIERPARSIQIYQIDIQAFSFPQAVIDVRCSKGTYIRTLSEDIAKKIHTFAHLTALRRTETAGFQIHETHTLEAIANLAESERDALLLPCDVLVRHFPKITLDFENIEHLRCGRPASYTESCPENTPIRVYSEQGEFIGLVNYLAKYQKLKVLRLMSTAQ